MLKAIKDPFAPVRVCALGELHFDWGVWILEQVSVILSVKEVKHNYLRIEIGSKYSDDKNAQ